MIPEPLEHKGHKVIPEPLEHKGRREILGPRERRGHKVIPEPQEHKGHRVIPEPQGRRGQRGQMGLGFLLAAPQGKFSRKILAPTTTPLGRMSMASRHRQVTTANT